MTRRLLCALTLLVLAACATPTRTAQPTGSSDPSTSSLPALTTTSSTLAGVVSTGTGPSDFHFTPRGPIRVTVEAVRCVDKAGDGWTVSWRVENRSVARMTGPLTAKVDDSKEFVFAPSLTLPGGSRLSGTSFVNGQGESVSVTWTVPGRPTTSFPVEVPDCKVDPADERAARQATTTTERP